MYKRIHPLISTYTYLIQLITGNLRAFRHQRNQNCFRGNKSFELTQHKPPSLRSSRDRQLCLLIPEGALYSSNGKYSFFLSKIGNQLHCIAIVSSVRAYQCVVSTGKWVKINYQYTSNRINIVYFIWVKYQIFQGDINQFFCYLSLILEVCSIFIQRLLRK